MMINLHEFFTSL